MFLVKKTSNHLQMRFFYLFLGALFLSFFCVGQTLPLSYQNRANTFFAKASAWVHQDSSYFVKSQNAFTSMVVKIPFTQEFGKAYVLIANDTVLLRGDSHNDADTLLGSQLITLPHARQELRLYSGKIEGRIEFHFFTTPSLPVKKKENTYRLEAACEEPFSVSQSVWRDGLPDPIGTPVATPVKFVIVHHSDGSNLAEDYLEEVRNIYLLHTQSRGFDDIGYNFLVAPNGVIYKGRDGRGAVAQDNVRGAHMCNKNDSTFAICMLGNFNVQLPTPAALRSFYALAAWKMQKENLDPKGLLNHSVGPTASNAGSKLLPHLAGHRDGCTPSYTECPGDLLHTYLPQVRDSLASFVTTCLVTDLKMEEGPKTFIYLNHTSLLIPKCNYKEVLINDVMGRLLFRGIFYPEMSISLEGMSFYRQSSKAEEANVLRIIAF